MDNNRMALLSYRVVQSNLRTHGARVFFPWSNGIHSLTEINNDDFEDRSYLYLHISVESLDTQNKIMLLE